MRLLLSLISVISLSLPVESFAETSSGQADSKGDKAGLVVLTTTVGTNPLVCSTTDTVTVAPGTVVTLCYEIVNNTLDVTYELHSLHDSVLGNILFDFPYALAPSALAFITQTYTALGSAVHDATWTVVDLDTGNVEVAQDSATVHVRNVIDVEVGVGTNSAVCSSSDEISVAKGLDVYFCYNIENISDISFELHTLTSDEGGTILQDFPYLLAPGAMAFITSEHTANSDIINHATWTVEDTDTGRTFSSIDSATVTVFDPVKITATVGALSSACALTKSVTVTEGTPVYFCFTIENLSPITFDEHTLVTSHTGIVLANFPYNLAPGAIAFITQELIASSSIVNLATWIVSTLSGYVASATDSASVNVIPFTPTPTNTLSPSDTPTPTSTETGTPTSEPTPTSTESDTPTSEPTFTATPTATATGTDTPLPTDSPTRTRTPSSTATWTETITPTRTQNYDIAPPTVDGQINALDLIDWIEFLSGDPSRSSTLFDFARFWE